MDEPAGSGRSALLVKLDVAPCWLALIRRNLLSLLDVGRLSTIDPVNKIKNCTVNYIIYIVKFEIGYKRYMINRIVVEVCLR